MIPEQIPVNNHYGNNSTTLFDFDFYIENKSQIVVTHTDMEGNVTTPILGVDYDIAEVGKENGSYITFPLEGSSYPVLGWNTETNDKELLTIALTLPVVQEAKYNKSGELNKKNLEYSFDYLTRLIQILYRILTRTVQLPEGSKQSIQDFIKDLQLGNYEARKWANYMGGTVDGYNYSAKYHAQEAAGYIDTLAQQGEGIIQRATEQADRSEAYADEVEFGMQWTPFKEANWSVAQDGIHYELLLDELPIVNAVYSGTWDDKQLACGVNINSTGSGCKLTSLNAFNGYALSAASVLGKYVHTQDLASDEWVIQHNLGHIPCVTLLDDNNIEMVGTIEHQTYNKCVVTFNNAVTGTAYLR